MASVLAPRWWQRVTDPDGWRAVAYAIVMLPLGIVTSVTVVTGWITAAALFAFPAYKPFLDQSSYTAGSHSFGSAGTQVAATVVGAGLDTLVAQNVKVSSAVCIGTAPCP